MGDVFVPIRLVMLLCSVSVGKFEKLYRADHGRKGPSTGYQSVEGAVIAEGRVLHEPEIVLYSENLVVPFGMIVYTREGWQPFLRVNIKLSRHSR